VHGLGSARNGERRRIELGSDGGQVLGVKHRRLEPTAG
jgi:hypothetical protein